jgi:hypothetical protein
MTQNPVSYSNRKELPVQLSSRILKLIFTEYSDLAQATIFKDAFLKFNIATSSDVDSVAHHAVRTISAI